MYIIYYDFRNKMTFLIFIFSCNINTLIFSSSPCSHWAFYYEKKNIAKTLAKMMFDKICLVMIRLLQKSIILTLLLVVYFSVGKLLFEFFFSHKGLAWKSSIRRRIREILKQFSKFQIVDVEILPGFKEYIFSILRFKKIVSRLLWDFYWILWIDSNKVYKTMK